MSVRLDAMPALARGYLAALASFARTPPDADTRLPATELVVDDVRVGWTRTARYNDACGFARGSVPITYPFVFSFPLQLALLTRPDSPLRVPGLVHLGVRLEYPREIATGDFVRVACTVGEQERTARGLEFTVVVTITGADGALRWRCDSRVLARGGERARRRGARTRHEVAGPVIDAFPVPASIGRGYAQVSGDWNPIHLGRLGARAGGFERPIAHGMWTLARTLAAADAGGIGIVDASFLAPLHLPARLEVRRDGARLGAFDAAAGRLVALAELKGIP